MNSKRLRDQAIMRMKREEPVPLDTIFGLVSEGVDYSELESKYERTKDVGIKKEPIFS